MKFCSRVVFNPDDKGLFSGIYLPLDLWKCLHANGRLKGPQGGNVVSFGNVGRKLSNSEFIELVANSWVGTTIPQSAELVKVIRAVLESGRTVTFAVKHLPAPDDAEEGRPSTFPRCGSTMVRGPMTGSILKTWSSPDLSVVAH